MPGFSPAPEYSVPALVAFLVLLLLFLVVRQEPRVRLFVSQPTATDLAHDEGDTLWRLWARVLREAGRPRTDLSSGS